MEVTFKFAIGQKVKHSALAVEGTVINLVVDRSGSKTVWIEYVAVTGKVESSYFNESECEAVSTDTHKN